ncbi:MAG TPA: class A beta-lactamase [Acetobacteraceae bacterium]|nr:class A beta-lactamase [Acetobacteraceae bacterium]
MTIHRRTLLAVLPAAPVRPVLAADETTARATGIAGTIAAHERSIRGRIGVFAMNLATGASIAWRANERFAMCSTFKASLAACVLARVDRGEDALDRVVSYGQADILAYAPVAKANLGKGGLSVAELCQAAVELSNNTCANLLLRRIGGPAALTAFWRATGDSGSRLDHIEPALNRTRPPDVRDTTTPAAMAGSLRRCMLGAVLSPASRQRLIEWMLRCKTGADLLRAGLPGSWGVGDKTGNNGNDALGDIAVAWPRPGRPVIICVYTQGGSAPASRLHAAFADIGRLIGQRLA